MNRTHTTLQLTSLTLLAKALLDRQNVEAHLNLPLLKHICGRPIRFDDLQYKDEALHRNLLQMLDLDPSIIEDTLCMDFTVEVNNFGVSQTILLKENGDQIPVTGDNLVEYMELRMRERVFDSVLEPLKAFLEGFYYVIPQRALLPLTSRELELALCGLPHVDIDDWIRNTEYTGAYAAQGRNHRVIRWFWNLVSTYPQERQVKLVQFATGTSRIPAAGFSGLQGRDGNILRFNITSLTTDQSIFMRAHTCFNRIDLPIYASQSDLARRVDEVLEMDVTGFTME